MMPLRSLTFEETAARLESAGVRPVHAAAVWRVLYRGAAPDQLPPPARRWLAGQLDEAGATVAATVDSLDGLTEKVLLRMADGQQVETVIMGYPGRFTACVSTQAGCAMGCVFCATGQMGFARHLGAGEIVEQVVLASGRLGARGATLRNLVLMGMGEPLHNYDEVMRALAIVSDRRGLNIAASRITVNTVGVVAGIRRLAAERQPYHLGVSLHGSTDQERAQLVPVAHRWPLAELIDACRAYTEATGRHVFFGWTLIEGVNDSPAHAARLAGLLAGIPAHVNLIHLNPTRGFAGAAAAPDSARAFRAVVQAAGIPCTIRQRRGIDVGAGCGQLTAARRAARTVRQAMR
jgi:23S rRNA (adenine2503-C2)-methyltransferase